MSWRWQRNEVSRRAIRKKARTPGEAGPAGTTLIVRIHTWRGRTEGEAAAMITAAPWWRDAALHKSTFYYHDLYFLFYFFIKI